MMVNIPLLVVEVGIVVISEVKSLLSEQGHRQFLQDIENGLYLDPYGGYTNTHVNSH